MAVTFKDLNMTEYEVEKKQQDEDSVVLSDIDHALEKRERDLRWNHRIHARYSKPAHPGPKPRFTL